MPFPPPRNEPVRLPPDGRGKAMRTEAPTCAPTWSMVFVPSATSPLRAGRRPLIREMRTRPLADWPARVCAGTPSMVTGLEETQGDGGHGRVVAESRLQMATPGPTSGNR